MKLGSENYFTYNLFNYGNENYFMENLCDHGILFLIL